MKTMFILHNNNVYGCFSGHLLDLCEAHRWSADSPDQAGFGECIWTKKLNDN
jgi:hypothetical protein